LQKAKAKGSAPKFVHRDLGAANRQKVKNPHPEKPQGAAPKRKMPATVRRALRAEKSKPAP
jgi:hypothetical protein